MPTWLNVLVTGISSGTLITAFLIVRKISRLEFMVETMWTAFEKRYGNFPREVKNRKW